MLRLLVFLLFIAPLHAAPIIPEFVENYCIDCHGDGTTKGGLDLGAIANAPLEEHRHIWEHAILRMDSRQMPPPKKNRPTEETYHAILTNLTTYLDTYADQNPAPGKVPALRRLTRTEYRHSVRDLLSIDLDVSELLPQDQSSHGFDNITVGDLSPTLLNRYVRAAQKIARTVTGNPQASPDMRIVRLPADQSQKEHVQGLPIGTRGGLVFDHHFPTDSEYDFVIRLSRDRNDEVEGLRAKHQIELLIDGEPAKSFHLERPKKRNHNKVDSHLKVRLPVPAGSHKIGVTFIKKSSSIPTTARQPYHAQYNFHRHPRQAPAIFQVSVSGPFGDQKPSATSLDLDRIMRLAYRRPVTESDRAALAPYLEQGPEMALAAILVSPRFLFRIEPSASPGQVRPLTDLELATRLSFFLWSSIPDEPLLTAKLTDPAIRESQVRRMLADPRADSLVTNFANQWLHLRNLSSASPDLRLFPDFDDNLRQSFRRETELLFQSILRKQRPVTELLTARHTFLNERLAQHYGIPGIFGSRFRRVTLPPDSPRGGLLRHGSILTVTSYANRTSPVIRGNWVLENILGTPAPPPPADIPSLDDIVIDQSLPMRAKLAAHSQKASCATCHDLMDPVGFALEQYDAVGRFLTHDVDAAGGLPNGQKFHGIDGLETGLAQRPDLFARTITEKLLTYSLGRGVDHLDAPAIRKILRRAAPENYRLTDLILGITHSLPFTHRVD